MSSGHSSTPIPFAGRPLVVVGKGAAFSQSDAQLRDFVLAAGIPFLATAMGRGVVPDNHELCANAARSAALRGADVAILFGARCTPTTRHLSSTVLLCISTCNMDVENLTWLFKEEYLESIIMIQEHGAAFNKGDAHLGVGVWHVL